MPGSWPRVAALALLAAIALAGCTFGGPPEPASPSSPGASPSSAKSVTPSITRDIPPSQRQQLASIPPDHLCDLVRPDDLAKLAFPVQPGRVRDLGGQPPISGCAYDALSGGNSVLIGVQPPGYDQVGLVQVNLGSEPGTETLHANDCTVFAGVTGATLQVVVSGSGTDSGQCDKAQGVAQYVLAALAR